MEWSEVIAALGGGVPAVVIIGLAIWGRGREKRADELVDKMIEMGVNTTNAMNELSRSIERGGK
ncbi:MAG: hypothetical protein CL484_03265 [Acidobacteria bacterium]|nr:hypothetical protein [Acidobacteriota bacterium]